MTEAPERVWLTVAEASWKTSPFDDMPVKQHEYISIEAHQKAMAEVWEQAIAVLYSEI